MFLFGKKNKSVSKLADTAKTLWTKAAGLCLKQKECTNLQQKASGFSKRLSALGHSAMGQKNSRKHRNLIEQKTK